MRYWILLIPALSFADVNTTGNLITNGDFNNGTNGWTLSGDAQRIGDCCPGGHDLEFGDYGSIEQSFNLISNSITQPMLNNGITLNSTVEVQNGEGGVGSWAPNRGGADTFTIRLQIQDENQNVLATTTQERTNVTGINGKDFSDSVTHTGTGSNIGHIFISGSDANAPANLGGPNVDNISVTMTYDDTVLTAEEITILNTAFEEIEEVLIANVETVEFEPIEEITFVPFEEPEMVIEMFSEIYVEEVAVEEISTGVVNVFTLAPPEEIIEMSSLPAIETFEEIQTEVSYGGQENFQEIPAEIESFEEIIEVRENSNIETTAEAIQGGEESSIEELVGGNESEGTESERGVPEESTVANREQPTEQVAEETETSPEPTETETIVASEEVNDETVGETETSESNEGAETTEIADASGENDQSTPEAVEESGSGEAVGGDAPAISVANIERQVSETIKEVDKQLVATSLIVAKAMQSSFSVDNYGKVNKDILNQPNIDGGEYYETREYIDVRNIYAQNQNIYSDIMGNRQEQIQQAADEVIRAEEHLRRIRGY